MAVRQHALGTYSGNKTRNSKNRREKGGSKNPGPRRWKPSRPPGISSGIPPRLDLVPSMPPPPTSDSVIQGVPKDVASRWDWAMTEATRRRRRLSVVIRGAPVVGGITAPPTASGKYYHRRRRRLLGHCARRGHRRLLPDATDVLLSGKRPGPGHPDPGRVRAGDGCPPTKSTIRYGQIVKIYTAKSRVKFKPLI